MFKLGISLIGRRDLSQIALNSPDDALNDDASNDDTPNNDKSVAGPKSKKKKDDDATSARADNPAPPLSDVKPMRKVCVCKSACVYPLSLYICVTSC